MYSEHSEYVAVPLVQVSSAPVLGRMANFLSNISVNYNKQKSLPKEAVSGVHCFSNG